MGAPRLSVGPQQDVNRVLALGSSRPWRWWPRRVGGREHHGDLLGLEETPQDHIALLGPMQYRLPRGGVETLKENSSVGRQLKKSRITKSLLKERIAAAQAANYTLLIDAAYFGMGGIGVPVYDEGGRIIAALSIGAASERIRSRETMLASALLLEAKQLSKALAVAKGKG